MKRDNDYLRQLMFEIEASEGWRKSIAGHLKPSPEEQKEEYHIELLCDEGLMLQISDYMYRLTSSGHDYIEVIRSDTAWQRTKDGAASIGGATLGMMKDIAVAYLKQEASKKLGIEL